MSTQIDIIENDVKSFRIPIETEMEKIIKYFEGELSKLRTGRAHASLVEEIRVSAYGQAPAPLKTLAAISTPEPRLIVVQPWDISIIDDIEKGIQTSDLGVTPVNDGKIIRLRLPEMSASQRTDLAKILNKKLEESRSRLRNIRKDFNNTIRDAKKNKTISEDFSNRLADVLQEVTDKFIKNVEQIAQVKEKAITTV
ncbi:ribosome recycling factor [Candidatus Dependentiae bacterium]|nr:ribosome recycling factor [Candidatus Dependentiae bacterium]